jgi:HEAT repeat protein
MYRMIGRLLAVSLLAIVIRTPSGHRDTRNPADRDPASGEQPSPALDVGALLDAAHGAPAIICALAAHSVGNSGWGYWTDAPSTPLSRAGAEFERDWERDHGRYQLSAADEDRLLAGLASDDACVRELSVRVLGEETGDRVANALETRLTSPDASLRAIAAFGLGLSESRIAADALIKTLHDATAAVRANSAWALGRLDNGRALSPLIQLFRDDDSTVRRAAVGAVGRMDSTSAVAALMRVLQQDQSPAVRRDAAWALGKLEAREAANALATTLGHDSDPRVREMSAWAIGKIEGASGAPALVTALQKDDDDKVREMAAWALARTEDRSALDALNSAATNDHSSRVRGTAAWAIGQLSERDEDDREGGRAPTGLLHVLKDPDDDARLKAAWALGRFRDSTTLPAIKEALSTETVSEVRRALVRALIKAGGRSDRALTDLLSSSDASVREAAVRGLAGAESFGPWPWPEPRPRPFP